MGFRWFAYVSGGEGEPNVITSYPRKWIERYVEEQYLNVDPVFRQARRPGPAFLWDFRDPKMARSMKERRFFDDALSADIRIGVTVPITAGFGRFAMFSLAADEPNAALEELWRNFGDGVNQAADFFSAATSIPSRNVTPLTTFGN
ncbi:autoinducer binding domain-containing protein [Methylocystis silviterrae]|uniref:autoinducer binding domain-containing protein n=1 Tax=Methylocystis silviterrae TaxID=2743612 RepID=UPI003C75B81D